MAAEEDDKVVVYGSVDSGGHTWTSREDRAVKTLARATVFTAIDAVRDAGLESEFEEKPIAAHDWDAIDEEVDRIFLTHRPVTADEIQAALAVLAPQARS